MSEVVEGPVSVTLGLSVAAADCAPLSDECAKAVDGVPVGSCAFRGIYTETVSDISAFVARRVPSDEVEDLVADTYVRAFEAFDSYEEQGNQIGWLLTIARNVVYNHSAKTGRRARLLPRLADERIVPSVDERVLDLDEEARIRSALARLSSADRALLEERFVALRPAVKIAEDLGVSPGSVRTASYRALRTLRAEFVTMEGSGQ